MKTESLRVLRQKTVARILKSRPLTKIQIEKELQALAKCTCARKLHPNPLRGQHILRFDLMTCLDEKKQFALETVFEKELAKEAMAAGDRKWANQIPIWSGICGSGDRKTNIDIGYSPEGGKFALYELKVLHSDHPLYAIIELFTYALGYLIVRELAEKRKDEDRDLMRIRNHDGGLLKATSILCSVIAPEKFYAKAPSGCNKLTGSELETLIGCAKEVLTDVAKERLGHACLQIEFSLLAMDMDAPPQLRSATDRDNWIISLKSKSHLRTLRCLVLNAKPIFETKRK